MSARADGFSLIEVTVALTMGSVLMAGALYVFNQTRFTAVEAGVRAELARDAQLALDVIGGDLAFLGAGVPAGLCQDASCTAGSALRPSIRRAGARGLVFLGDAPYPNAELPGLVSIVRFQGDADSDRIAVTSEVNGACAPHATTARNAFRCRTSTTTHVPMPQIVSPDDDCAEGRAGARTCPWALHKWQRGVGGGGSTSLVATDARGGFYARRWSGATSPVNDFFGVQLQTANAGVAALPRSEFFTAVGAGQLVQLDRVFYAVENAAGGECSGGDCVLKRRQCWGLVDAPTASDFPASGTAFVSSTTSIRSCAAPDDGTPWEVVVQGIESFSFAYAGSATLPSPVEVGKLAEVRSVDVSFTLKRATPAGGPVLRHRVEHRFFLENRDTR